MSVAACRNPFLCRHVPFVMLCAMTTDLVLHRVYHGFQCEQLAPLPNLRAEARRFTHLASGARLLHIQAPDSENCLAVTFATPPPDDTGLPHILEHAVLGGSRRYPVREPFFEMLKMSLATFINAFTAQTHTSYPICSPVKQDFFNLAEVYLDAVFHPELTENTFRREGHHLAFVDPRDPESALQIKGIVYSEMKGAESNPERRIWSLACRGLYPDTPLGRNSGGDPEHIPDLTYAAFREFHDTRYHPSNALIFLYGDIPTAEHLRFLDRELAGWQRRPVALATPRQPSWSAPRQLEGAYPLGPDDPAAARTFLSLNWVVGDALDPATVTAWEVLDQLLLGHEGAPLRKALIDSRLGADTFMCGTCSHAYEQEFHVGLKGSETDRAEAFEQCVRETLERWIAQPVPAEALAAAFQQLAYSHLEVATLFPLHVLQAVSQAWPHGADPLAFLHAEKALESCRQRCAADPGLLGRLVRTSLLDNPHCLRVVLRPDRELEARREAALSARLTQQRAALSPAQRAAVARAAEELEALNGVPNPPEALAALPQLSTRDLPEAPRRIPTSSAAVAGLTVLRNDVFANGVNYLELDLDLAGLPADLVPALPRFLDAWNKLGAAGQDYAAIAQRRASHTGGLWAGWRVARHATDAGRLLHRVRIGLKTLDGTAGEALRLLGDLLFRLDPRDRDRLRDVLNQAQAACRTALIGDGPALALRQAGRGLSPEAALEQRLSASPETLHDLERLTGQFDSQAERIMDEIVRLRDLLLNRRRWTLSFTGSDCVYRELTGQLAAWSAELRDELVPTTALPFTASAAPACEGLAVPIQVAHCARALPAPYLSHPDAPLLEVAARLLGSEYCLPEIRFKGHAYGAGAQYQESHGLFRLYSGWDPRIAETLAVFEGARQFVESVAWTQTDVDRAIINCAQEAERPIRPGEATGTALNRHVRGDTAEQRAARYTARRQATPAEVKRVLLALFDQGRSRAATCVVASRERLEAVRLTPEGQGLTVADALDFSFREI